MLFRLTEYDRAAKSAFWEGADALMCARDPLIAQLPRREVEHVRPSRVTVDEETVVELQPLETELEGTMTISSVTDGDLSEVYLQMDTLAAQMCEVLVPAFIERLNELTEATGNVVDAHGGGFSWDQVNEAIDKMALTFDEDGAPNVQILVGPGLRQKMDETPPTEEQREALETILERKRAEFRASKRRRRLS